MNKNGVKLLAAVMAFAMVLVAGIIVINDSDNLDATAPESDPFTGLYEDTANYSGGVFTLTKDTTITLTKDLSVTDVSFALEGHALTITSEKDKSYSLTINYTATKAGQDVFTNGTLNVNNADLSVTLGATSEVNNEEASLHILDVKMTMNIEGKSTVTFKQNANGQTIAEGSEIKLAGAGAKLVLDGCNTVGNTKLTMDASKLEINNPNATALNVYLTMTNGAEIKLTGASSGKGDINLYNASVTNSKITTDGAVKFYNGIDKNAGTFTMTGSVIGAKTFGDFSKDGSGITLTGGTFTGDITLKDKVPFKFVGATYNGTVTSVTEKDSVTTTSTATLSNIKANSESGFTISEGSIKINGIIQEAQNGKITVSSGELAIADAETTIPKGVTLIIEEGAELTGTTVINNGTIETYGTVTVGTLTNNGKMVITPESDFNGKITNGENGSIVQNPDMEKAFYIGGELENSMPITNATLNDDLHIPEGMTLTVNGNFFLNGRSITVDGELIINKNASIYDLSGGKLIIGKGKITNNGIIGNAKPVSVAFGTITSNIKAVQMQGVSGVNFEVKKVAVDKAVDATGYKNVLIVSGDIGRISSVQKNELTISNAIIGDMTVAKRVTLVIAGDAVETASGTTLTVDGDISAAATKEITLGMNSEYNLNGSSKNVTVVVKTGELKNNTEFEGTPSKVKIAVGDNATGFSIYTKKVSVTTGSTTKYEMRAYIEGAVDKIVTPVTTETETAKKTDQTVTITGEFYVASGATLSFSKDVDLTKLVGTGFKANVQGTIAIDGQDNGNDVLKGNYVGAMYSITVKDGTAIKSETLYYTTFDAAIAIIADVDEKTVTSTITEVESDFTVGAEQTVNFVGTTVSSKATVTVENDGTVSKINVVEGMVVVKDGGNCSIPASGYAAKTVSEDNTTTYAGLKIAIENAKAGDVITISSGETGESLTIPAGVTVNVNNDLKVKGNLTVSEGAKLVIKGTLTMTSTDKDVTVDVIGTFDASAGSYVEGTNATLKSSGTSVFQNLPTRYSGAYYENDSNYYVTTVSKAVEGAVAAEQDTVYINGTVNDSTEISLKDMTLALNEGATVRLGNVNLDNSTVDADATGAKLTATVIGMNGDGDKAVSSSVKTSESNIVIVQTATEKADETVSNKFTVSTVNGTVTVATGNVNFASDLVMTDGKLIVDAGATLVLNVKTDINGGEFTVNGTVDVVGKVLTLAADKATVNGTVNVSKSGQVVLNKAIINGTVDVKTETDKTNKLTIATDGFVFGKPVESIGATASIIGNVEFGAGVDYIIAYPGIDLSQAIINADSVTKESTAVTTVFTVNGVEYATVYANEDSTKIGDVFELDQIKEIKGLDFKNVTALEWTDLDGEKKNSSNVGDVATVGAEFDYAKQTVTVSVGTGISLYIDGVKYASGSEPQLTVGEHKVSATVNPGYKGTVDIMVNGVKITSGVFTIDVGKDVVVSATGEISIDNGNTSASSSSDDGMGITDYLLIVLVVLAAILVVIVALRMMRS